MAIDETPPPRVAPKVISAPRVKQVYWCNLPVDAQLPEFWKKRPIIVISPNTKLHGHVTVVPLTTKPQPDNKNAHRFVSLLPGETISWAVCDHILTVAVSRLIPPSQKIPKVDDADFQEILKLVLKNIPTPR